MGQWHKHLHGPNDGAEDDEVARTMYMYMYMYIFADLEYVHVHVHVGKL